MVDAAVLDPETSSPEPNPDSPPPDLLADDIPCDQKNISYDSDIPVSGKLLSPHSDILVSGELLSSHSSGQRSELESNESEYALRNETGPNEEAAVFKSETEAARPEGDLRMNAQTPLSGESSPEDHILHDLKSGPDFMLNHVPTKLSTQKRLELDFVLDIARGPEESLAVQSELPHSAPPESMEEISRSGFSSGSKPAKTDEKAIGGMPDQSGNSEERIAAPDRLSIRMTESEAAVIIAAWWKGHKVRERLQLYRVVHRIFHAYLKDKVRSS